ncbi:DNA topoisomerase III [Macrococcus capreoli]
MSILIIAEKPSQAKAYADAFNIKERTKTYIELSPCQTFPNGAIITWGIGHLIQLKMPNELSTPINSWNLSSLPTKAHNELKISDGKQQQFNAVKKLALKADLIINACDCDREGSNIFYLILEYAGVLDKPIKRLWINSLESDVVRKGFSNLMDNKKDVLMYQEAKARMVSDYLIGMNLSPLYTVKLAEMGLNNNTFGIGRVQTPTLYMIYQRYLDILNFKEEDFFEIHAKFKHGDKEYIGKLDFKEKNVQTAQDVLEKIRPYNTGEIQDVERLMKKLETPNLHSLSTLQTVANKIWKYSPKKTLELTQSLYEKKLVTYPRTDTKYITENEFSYLVNNIDHYLELFNLDHKVVYKEPRNKYVNSKKVQEHFAIILTKNISRQEIDKLSADEKNIYREIYNRTIAMFLEDYEYETTKLITSINEYEFISKGRVDKKLGWKSLIKDEEDTEATLPNVEVGMVVEASPYLYEGKTKPPNLYTEGQLINLMKTCGKFLDEVEDVNILKDIEGIGTEATRADVIDKLKHHDYIKVSKNKVNITDKGILLCRAITNTLLSSPEMTAKWEKALKGISLGKMTFNSFIQNTEKYINYQIDSINQELVKNDVKQLIVNVNSENEIGKCPKCKNGDIIKKNTKKFTVYSCNQECGFVLFDKYSNKNLSESVIKELVTKGRTTKEIKGFKTQAGKVLNSKLKLNKDYKITYDFDKNK